MILETGSGTLKVESELLNARDTFHVRLWQDIPRGGQNVSDVSSDDSVPAGLGY